jgi:hypothetical protein
MVTVEDRYHELGERIKSLLDSPELAPLHSLIAEVEKIVEGLVGSGHRTVVIAKTRKSIIAAVNSRIDRQLAGSSAGVRQYRPHRRLDWRNK